ncbi:DUF1289 domain-containing protein [Shewanella sp. A25]|nr:DUF1289 domain-containing protein [Shewanella shenzhenensis]
MQSGQNKNNSDSISNPCVRNCCLDQQDICMGCFRHLDEILGWRTFTDEERFACYRRMAERKATFQRKLKWR